LTNQKIVTIFVKQIRKRSLIYYKTFIQKNEFCNQTDKLHEILIGKEKWYLYHWNYGINKDGKTSI